MQLKPAGTPCRDSSNSCDLPEFCTGSSPHCPANVYLHDGHACHNVDGYCYNGICQTHEQQCITLWGQGMRSTPLTLELAHTACEHFNHFLMCFYAQEQKQLQASAFNGLTRQETHMATAAKTPKGLLPSVKHGKTPPRPPRPRPPPKR